MGKLELADYRLEGDKQIATHVQDTTSILAFNAEQRRNSDENWQKADEDLKAVARIPLSVWLRLEAAGIADDAKELDKWLEENPQFKRTEKQLAAKPGMIFDLAGGRYPSVI